MKKNYGINRIIVITGIIFCMVTGIAYAELETPNAFELSANLLYIDYKESLPTPFKSNEKDAIGGARMVYTYQGIDNPFYGRVLGEFYDGQLTYDGTDQEGTPVKAKSDATIMVGEADIGYNIKPLKLIVYTGIGYRDWNRFVARQYTEDYRWKYWPIGLRGSYRINENISGAIDVSARYAFGGTIKVYLTDLAWGYNAPTADLGEKWGYRVEAPVEFKVPENPNWTLVATPWFEYFEIGQSNEFEITYHGEVIGYGYEPSSKTKEYGVNLGIKYRF